jgi:hypothetical protein
MSQDLLSSNLSVAEAEAAGEGMVASDVTRAASATVTLVSSDHAPFYCAVCNGQILSRDSINLIPTVRRLPGTAFYCPSCEMFVEPVEDWGTHIPGKRRLN